MADAVVRLNSRLSPEAMTDLMTRVGIDASPGNTSRRQFQKATLKAVESAPDSARMKLEGIAGRIVAFAERDEFAETALRTACWDLPQLMALCDADSSIEERALRVLFEAPKTFDRASSISTGHHWRGGRQHSLFETAKNGDVSDSINEAVTLIKKAMERQQAGRRVATDEFTYRDLLSIEDGQDPAKAPLAYHVSVYLEAPASYWLEFEAGPTEMTPVLRSEAKEIAIDYYPATGELHVAARGVGGSKVLHAIAEIFGTHALETTEIALVERQEMALGTFLTMSTPVLPIPSGFAKLDIVEVSLRSRQNRAALATFKGGDSGNAYTRMREVGVTADKLAGELIRSVTVELATSVDPAASRSVRATLNWPNRITFDGASPAERRSIQAWAHLLKE